MILYFVDWTPRVNMLRIRCQCGADLRHPASISVVQCPTCGRRELWHPVKPVVRGSIWDFPVMTIDERLCAKPKTGVSSDRTRGSTASVWHSEE